jgi:fatty acid desaturase
MAYIRANGIKAPEGGLALPLPYTVCERPTYSVVPSNAFWRDPARADIAEILRKNEEDNRRRDLYFPLVMRDARRIGEYYPGLSPNSPECMDRLGVSLAGLFPDRNSRFSRTSASLAPQGGRTLQSGNSMAYQAQNTLRTAMPERNLLDRSAMGTLTRRSDLCGVMQLAAHAACLATTALIVWFATPVWYLLIPAMALHGVPIVTMFAPMHECVHRTAFASRAANETVGWLAGVVSFYNSTYYRYYHTWHHRYTQDPARDPELIYPKASTRLGYFKEITGMMFWLRRAIDYPALAFGRTQQLPFVPDNARRRIAFSVSMQLLIYSAGAVSVMLGFRAVLYYWFLPAILAQPFLRALLIVEHAGCSQDGNGLTNTRTTLTWFPIRLLMWNMPYHAEHHLCPSIPFHQLPALHVKIRGQLKHLASSYVAANRAVVHPLYPSRTN